MATWQGGNQGQHGKKHTFYTAINQAPKQSSALTYNPMDPRAGMNRDIAKANNSYRDTAQRYKAQIEAGNFDFDSMDDEMQSLSGAKNRVASAQDKRSRYYQNQRQNQQNADAVRQGYKSMGDQRYQSKLASMYASQGQGGGYGGGGQGYGGAYGGGYNPYGMGY